jgi:plasmid stabilization system protein ParE
VAGRHYRVVAAPDALSDYVAIVEHIERWTGDRALARRTIESIRTFIRGLGSFPPRGAPRDDLRPGLRLIPFGKRTVIAFEIDDDAGSVTILRVFYGGQDYEAVIR